MQDVFNKFFIKFAYKFDKGYPDMNNEQDILLLEKLLGDVLGEPILLAEVNLNPTQLIKPYHSNHEFYGQYKDRGERFLEKIENGEPLELVNGSSVKIDLEKSSEAIELLKSKKYSSLAGVKKMFFDDKGNSYSLSNFSKTEEFGSGSGSGGGTAQTDVQESTQCLFNALSYRLKKGKLTEQDCTQENFEKVKQYVITTTSFEDMIKFALEEKSWQNTMIQTANALYVTYPNKNFIFHRQSPFVKNLENTFNIAKKKENLSLNKDKWNPADIWMVDKSISNIKFEEDLETLNSQILELYHEEKLIGVSLKKIGKSADITVYNSEPVEHEYSYEGYTSSEKSKYSTILFNEGRIAFRSFNYADNFAGEIQGKSAAHGKIGMGIINNFVNKNTTENIPPTKEIRAQIYDNDPKFKKKLYQLFNKYVKKMKSTDFDEYYNAQNEDWKFSKYISLILVHIFENLPKEDADNLINNIVLYAKSSSSISSTFVKVS